MKVKYGFTIIFYLMQIEKVSKNCRKTQSFPELRDIYIWFIIDWMSLIKPLKITVFIVQKHLAHTNNFESYIRFVGEELQEPVLAEYFNFCKSIKIMQSIYPSFLLRGS